MMTKHTPRQWQVEWMSRPDEAEHIEACADFRAAHRLAKEMSDKHDGSAVVVALDERPDGGMQATGHMEYVFGVPSERAGCCINCDWPSAKSQASSVHEGK